MDRLSITVPCHLRYRDAVGALIQQVCNRLEQNGATGGLGYQVVSAFNEAFNNLAQYAYDPDHGGVVDVLLELSPEQLTVELQDTGKTFEYDTIESPDLDALPETGLGIFIIRSFMSDVSYQPGGDGRKNRFRMTRRLETHRGEIAVQGTNDA